MHNRNRHNFDLLKQMIVNTMQQSYPGINPSISEWKGQEITDFQEDLLIKVNAHISEKWFYSHIKSENHSLPRIDVLNLLSRYAGYSNWDDFVFKNDVKEETIIQSPNKSNRYFIIVPLILAGVMVILYLAFRLYSTREYKFNFYDSDTREPVTGSQISVSLLHENESPVNYLSDNNGSFILKTNEREVKMIISAPYYRTDTITRVLKTFDNNQMISLHPNEYALIIHYFSEMNEADWQKRRAYLENIIDNAAMIYQVMGTNRDHSMELYNKQEFIDKMTIPSGSLKHIEILDTRFRDNRIAVLRFRINNNIR